MSDINNTNAEDSDLEYTRMMRKKLVDDITTNGSKMPADIKDRSILLQALDGMDRAALTKKKIASDEGINDKQVMAAEIIAQIFNTKNLKENRTADDFIEGEIRVLDDNLEIPVINPGELDAVTPAIDYNAFVAKMENQ
jgi:hypothetical protein